MKIKWGRSNEGYVLSKCGRFRISPLYWGRANPQDYELVVDNKKIIEIFLSQKKAKQHTESL